MLARVLYQKYCIWKRENGKTLYVKRYVYSDTYQFKSFMLEPNISLNFYQEFIMHVT